MRAGPAAFRPPIARNRRGWRQCGRIRLARLPLTKSSSTLAPRWKSPPRNRGN